MSARPRFRINAQVLAQIMAGQPSGVMSVPSRSPLTTGQEFEADLDVTGAEPAIGRVQVVAVVPGPPGSPATVSLRIIAAHREAPAPVAAPAAPDAAPAASSTPDAAAAPSAPEAHALAAAPASAAVQAPAAAPVPDGTPAPAGTPAAIAPGVAPAVSSAPEGTPAVASAPAAAQDAVAAASSPAAGQAPPAPHASASGELDKAASAAGGAAARTSGLYAVASRPNLPEELRRPAELTAEYTRTLVKLLNRTQYYGAQAKSRDAEAMTESFELLRQLIGDRNEFGFVIERAQGEVDLNVDGVGEERRKLLSILRPEVYETFVPKLIDYFEKYQLVALAYKKEVTQTEWTTVLELMSSMQAGEAAKRLTAELLARDVTNVSVLTASDLVGKDFGLPWQIRVALARITRDLKALPMLKQKGIEAMRRHRMNLIGDVIRPFTGPQHMKLLLIYCPTVQEQADKIAELEGKPVEEVIGEVLRPERLAAAAAAIFDDYKAGRTGEAPYGPERYQKVLISAALRLGRGSHEEGFALLRDLYKEKLLTYEELPADLQEWVDAEELSRSESPAHEPPRGSDTVRWNRTLSKAARLLSRNGQYDKAIPVLLGLLEAGEAAREPFVAAMKEATAELINRYCSGKRAEREGYVVLLKAVAADAAQPVVDSLVGLGDTASSSPQFQLLTAFGKAAGPAVKAALGSSGQKPAVLRALLLLASKLADPAVVDLVQPLLRHPDARVRAPALTTYAAMAGPLARPALVEALGDKDAHVATQALLAMAGRKDRTPEGDKRAAEILGGSEDLHAVLSALRYAAITDDEAVREALGHCVDRELGAGGGLRRLLGGSGGEKRPDVFLAAVPALAAAGDGGRLKKLAKQIDPSVRNAADIALRTLD